MLFSFGEQNKYTNNSYMNERETGKKPTKKEFNYKEQFGVIVICNDEKHQMEVFDELKQKGLKLKVVTV